jgi:HPt (histidine-containing phosphotransfer) domain-containing protein
MRHEPVLTAIRARLAEIISDDDPDDVEFARHLLCSFIDRAPALLDALSVALAAMDAPTVVDRAHALKGAAANVGADSVARLCAEVEIQARGACLDLAQAYPTVIGAELAEATRHLSTVVDSLPATRG